MPRLGPLIEARALLCNSADSLGRVRLMTTSYAVHVKGDEGWGKAALFVRLSLDIEWR